jgi:hypothetical protein|tara:strand:+ start:75 stop:368 length:294 start_codon:yes stop_codon:yes gene_type:complete
MTDSDEPTKKVNFKVIIPEDFEIETVKIFRKIKDSQELEELEAVDSDEDDSDYIPESSDDELDAYEYAELSDKDRKRLRKELQEIILENEWFEFNQS